MPALEFFNPWLLLGLLAAAIPFVLHLLSSVRAQEAQFPTLRFLRISMEKTARRRRIQHWALLSVRAALLAVLCLAVAEPISKATGGWLGRSSYTAGLVLDNSYSMATRDEGGSRFDRAKAQAAGLLGGEDMPAQGSLLTTSGGFVSSQLTNRLDTLRDALSRSGVGYGRPALARRFVSAVETLERQSSPRKAVYIFSDLQRTTFEELLAAEELTRAKDVYIFIVNTGPAADKVVNAGIEDLEIAGRRVVDSSLEFTVRLVNSSASARAVDVGMRLDGGEPIQRMRVNLAPSGRDGSIATVRFHTQFSKPGPVSGEVYIEQPDDLPVDNVRRFCLDIGEKINVLVVRGPLAGDEGAWMDSGAWLALALQPYADAGAPWPIACRMIDASRFGPSDLTANLDAAFFSDVPSFNPAEADAVRKFVREGGTAVFFLGPNVQADSYNRQFTGDKEPLLPAALGQAVGVVDPVAPAQQAGWLDINHPYFQKLWANPADYFSQAIGVQRYYQLAAQPAGPAVLAKLRNGDTLLAVTNLGAGRAVLCTTTASPRWSNLPNVPLFLPLINRMALLARQDAWRDAMFTAGAQATIRLGQPPTANAIEAAISQPEVRVTMPGLDDNGQPRVAVVKAGNTAQGLAAVFTDTASPGEYRWTSAGKTGLFVVNPAGGECRLATISPNELQQALASRGLKHVYIGESVAEVSALAAKDAQGRNWWDLAVVAAIMLLVFEAVIANRRKITEQADGAIDDAKS